MNINLIADSSVASAPAGFTDAVEAAAAIYEQDFPGNYTVNIRYGWGTFDNQPNSDLQAHTDYSLGGTEQNFYNISYSTLKAFLVDDASLPDEAAAVASLPDDASSLPAGGNALVVSSAEAKALGEFGGDSTALDGAIGFGTSTTYWEKLALVEIGHALGWSTDFYAGAPTILDLYRYSSPGQHQFTGGQPAYLSIDGGQTNLGNYATTFDDTLFSDHLNDPFQAPATSTTSSTLTGLDQEVLHLLGFGSQPQPPLLTFYVDGSQGRQTIIGSSGVRNFIVTGNAFGTGTVLVDLKDGFVSRGTELDATLANIQGVQLGAEPSVVLGYASGAELIYGGSGADSYYGEGATDTIRGGTGSNAFVGGAGNEIFYGTGGADVMKGGSASNFMQAGPTAGSVDMFYGSGGQDYIYGGAGTTTLYGSSGFEVLTGGSGQNTLIGSNQSAGLDVLHGGTGTDIFYAGIGTNLFDEGSGTDLLAGNAGTDYVYGGSGKSYVYGATGTEVISTGAGNQYVRAGSGATFFNDTAANLTAGRFDQIDNFSGGQGTSLYLPTALQGATSFASVNGGTAVLTAVSGGTAEIFASGIDVATVQAHTHFTL